MSKTMPPDDWYYTVKPNVIEVSKEEFENYIKNYPRKLDFDACGISDPTALSWNDFELADRWPYSIVANTWDYDEYNGTSCETPKEERSYYVVENIEAVYASKTGKTVKDWDELCQRKDD